MGKSLEEQDSNPVVTCQPEIKSLASSLKSPASSLKSPASSLKSPASSLKSPPIAEVTTPEATPLRRALSTVQTYLEEVGQLTRLNLQEDWLPITESRNGNVYYSAFHALSSGIGFQALVLPLTFIALGWIWGIVSLIVTFVWQLYTLWLLIQLHESVPGTRYSRYLQLSKAAFGERLGKILALLPTIYLASGTCVGLIMIGGGTMNIFFHIICSTQLCDNNPLTTVEWYVVFTGSAVLLAQLPNLNSIAGVSLIGAITAISYCTIIWVVSVARARPSGVHYGPLKHKSVTAGVCSVLDALGIIAFAFRGHNLVLEIQGTMPTSSKRPSRIPMWKGVKFSYLIIAMCLFPIAIGGYWSYGNLIPSGGMLSALYKYHKMDAPKFILGIASLLVVINCLTSFQIYAMPVFDNLEFKYTSCTKHPCPRWLRAVFRILYGCFAFFIAVALPFLPSLAGLVGGITLPVTLAYPCFMWVIIRKPVRYTPMWCLNWGLGCFGDGFERYVGFWSTMELS